MPYTSKISDRLWWDKPPNVEHEYLANLEKLNITASQGREELNHNLQNISNKLEKASAEEIEAIEVANEAMLDEIRESREEATLYAELAMEEAEQQHEERMEAIEDVSSKISNLTSVVSSKLGRIDDRLATIDMRISMVNATLNGISNQMDTLLQKISTPNEVKALELTNQARINLALKKKELALKATEEALELTSSTSIMVLAYHILTLSLFDDTLSQKKLITFYSDYINLINFKLSDMQSDKEMTIQEISSTLFPVMGVMQYINDDTVMLLTQNLYITLYTNHNNINSFILNKPLHDIDTREIIDYPSKLREMHWSILLKEYIIKNPYQDSMNHFATSLVFIHALAQSNTPIKNELMILAVKNFYEKEYLYRAMNFYLLGANYDEMLWETLDIIVSLLPQEEFIHIDDKTYWAMNLYATKRNIPVNALLKHKISEAETNIQEDIEQHYITDFDHAQEELYSQETHTLEEIEKIRAEYPGERDPKMKNWAKHDIDTRIQKYESNVKEKVKELDVLDKKINDGMPFAVFFGITSVILVGSFIYDAMKEDHGFFAWIGALIVLAIALALLAGVSLYIIGPILGSIRDSITNSKIEAITKSLDENKIKMDNMIKLYDENFTKIDNLCKKLEAFKTAKENSLNNTISDIIFNRYVPRDNTKILENNDFKEECGNHVYRVLLNKFLTSKYPGDLKFKQYHRENHSVL